MYKSSLIFLATLTFFACSDNTAVKNDDRSTTVTGDTVAEMTKKDPNATTRQATDAWFVHRITSFADGKNMNSCHLQGEFENKGDVALYQAQAKYRTIFTENAIQELKKLKESYGDNYITPATFALEYGQANMDPLLPGETRPVLLKLFNSCNMFVGIELFAFVAQAVNADGSVKYRAVKDGAPALIIDNQTNFMITRDED